jgi:hypothetical protein
MALTNTFGGAIMAIVKPKKKMEFTPPKGTERRFAVALRKVAKHSAGIIHTHVDGAKLVGETVMMARAVAYSQALDGWASRLVGKTNEEINAANQKTFKARSKVVGRELRRESGGPVGEAMRSLHDDQVKLIKSIPLDAAQRAQRLAREAMMDGTRAATVAEELANTEGVTLSRATLIARTEIAKSNATISQARAESVGLDRYFWRCVEDADVRDSHRAMADRSDQGETFSFSGPPEVDEGGAYNPGEIYNCFTGDTPVNLDNGLMILFRAFYQGQIIDITVDGVSFSVTPNHPILTGRGWIPASGIKQGDYLIQAIDQAFTPIENENNNSQLTFEKIFMALGSGVKSHPAHLFNFHGDVTDHDVDTITVDHHLLIDGMSEFFKCCGYLAFSVSDGRVCDPTILSGNSHVFKTNTPGLDEQGAAIVLGKIPHADQIGFRPGASLNSRPDKPSGDSQTVYSVNLGKPKLAYPLQICGDDFSLRQIRALIGGHSLTLGNIDAASPEALADNIRSEAAGGCSVFKIGSRFYKCLRVINAAFRDSFHGYVYSLQSVNGWFTITHKAIISKNCRCFAEIFIPEAEGL